MFVLSVASSVHEMNGEATMTRRLDCCINTFTHPLCHCIVRNDIIAVTEQPDCMIDNKKHLATIKYIKDSITVVCQALFNVYANSELSKEAFK